MVDSTTLDTTVPFPLPTKVTIGGIFSYSNSVFNKTASTLGATSPFGASIADFETIRVNLVSTTTATATTITGSNVTGSTARFTTISGSTVTGSTALFTTITASNISYAPANAAHWTDPDPTTIKQAIDRLAAQLYAISGSIP